MKYWHNPRCTKSRQGLKLLGDLGKEVQVIRYLEDPPSKAELTRVLKMLKMDPRELMRHKEPVYKELHLDNPKISREKLIEAMVRHPVLIERPVLIRGNRAAIGRPTENLKAIL